MYKIQVQKNSQENSQKNSQTIPKKIIDGVIFDQKLLFAPSLLNSSLEFKIFYLCLFCHELILFATILDYRRLVFAFSYNWCNRVK